MSRHFRLKRPAGRSTPSIQRPLLNGRGRGHRHAMTSEDVHHFCAVGWAASSSTDYFGSLAEVRGTHDRRRNYAELFHILAAEVIEAVRRATGYAQSLPGTNFDGCAVNRPCKDALDTIEDFLVGVVLVGWSS